MDKPVRFFVYRVTVTRPDGTVRSAVVKTTSRERDPGASVFALHAELARLQEHGEVVKASVSIPGKVGPKQRERMQRWTETIPGLLA